MDGAKTKNISECPITARLYDNIGEKGDGKNKKNCTEPGCFFIYEQMNLGWDFPSFLVGNKRRGMLLYLTGCIYDIPHLLERTKGKERINRALRAVRACYIGKRMDAGKSQHCQPEYEGEGQISLNQGMDPITRKDKHRDTWAGRFLPSTQNRCFVEFLNGIFYIETVEGAIINIIEETKVNETNENDKNEKEGDKLEEDTNKHSKIEPSHRIFTIIEDDIGDKFLFNVAEKQEKIKREKQINQKPIRMEKIKEKKQSSLKFKKEKMKIIAYLGQLAGQNYNLIDEYLLYELTLLNNSRARDFPNSNLRVEWLIQLPLNAELRPKEMIEGIRFSNIQLPINPGINYFTIKCWKPFDSFDSKFEELHSSHLGEINCFGASENWPQLFHPKINSTLKTKQTGFLDLIINCSHQSNHFISRSVLSSMRYSKMIHKTSLGNGLHWRITKVLEEFERAKRQLIAFRERKDKQRNNQKTEKKI
uniref:Uncharacterized protein n=1 Tax=Meloidogyne javanica TaxID=6303 RepID=A0A915MWN5_MELJA